jgi:hypothetical protein
MADEPQAASTADVAERLFAEFTGRHPLRVVTAVVQQSRHELSDVAPAALPELLERLARQRLTELPPAAADPSGNAG